MKQLLLKLNLLLSISVTHCQFWFPSLQEDEAFYQLLSSETSIKILEKRKQELQAEIADLEQHVDAIKQAQHSGGWAAASWVSDNVISELAWKRKMLDDLDDVLNKRRIADKQSNDEINQNSHT